MMIKVRAPRPVAVPRGALAVAALAGLVQRALRALAKRTVQRRSAPVEGRPSCA
jgi:hypothetical protein